jgi:hypothetical protein
VKGDDGAERVGGNVHAIEPESDAHSLHRVDQTLDRQGPLDSMRAPRAGQVRTHRPLASHSRQDRRPHVGRAAESVDHQHGLARAVGLDGHAVDELRGHQGLRLVLTPRAG